MGCAQVEQPAAGKVDPARICIVGASYGGYVALQGGARRPDLFKCVVSRAGLSDLARLLAEPWFALAPPKSTGREQFHLDWLQARMGEATTSPADVQTTLLELTVATVAEAGEG